MLGFMGIQDVTVIYAAGTSKARQGVDRGTILEPALTSIRAQFQAA
jgi:FMN-dependent NADH-azoreductase